MYRSNPITPFIVKRSFSFTYFGRVNFIIAGDIIHSKDSLLGKMLVSEKNSIHRYHFNYLHIFRNFTTSYDLHMFEFMSQKYILSTSYDLNTLTFSVQIKGDLSSPFYKIISGCASTFYNLFMFEGNQIPVPNDKLAKDIIMSDSSVISSPSIYFSALENFDKGTASILVNNNLKSDNIMLNNNLISRSLSIYDNYDNFFLNNLNKYYNEKLICNYDNLYKASLYEYMDQIPYLNTLTTCNLVTNSKNETNNSITQPTVSNKNSYNNFIYFSLNDDPNKIDYTKINKSIFFNIFDSNISFSVNIETLLKSYSQSANSEDPTGLKIPNQVVEIVQTDFSYDLNFNCLLLPTNKKISMYHNKDNYFTRKMTLNSFSADIMINSSSNPLTHVSDVLPKDIHLSLGLNNLGYYCDLTPPINYLININLSLLNNLIGYDYVYLFINNINFYLKKLDPIPFILNIIQLNNLNTYILFSIFNILFEIDRFVTWFMYSCSLNFLNVKIDLLNRIFTLTIPLNQLFTLSLSNLGVMLNFQFSSSYEKATFILDLIGCTLNNIIILTSEVRYFVFDNLKNKIFIPDIIKNQVLLINFISTLSYCFYSTYSLFTPILNLINNYILTYYIKLYNFLEFFELNYSISFSFPLNFFFFNLYNTNFNFNFLSYFSVTPVNNELGSIRCVTVEVADIHYTPRDISYFKTIAFFFWDSTISLFNASKSVFDYFFKYVHTTTVFTIYNIEGAGYKYITLCSVESEYRYLPLGFFIPFATFNKSDYCKVYSVDVVLNSFNSSLFNNNDYFSNLSNPSNIWNFVEIWMVYELNKNYNHENNLLQATNYINNSDSRLTKLKSLEYQRYNNYVLKHKCYKEKI